MSYRYDDEKRRPPPIHIPPFPPPTSRPSHTREPAARQQQDNRNASFSTQQGYRSTGSTPLTTPVEPTGTLLPPTGSGRSRKATFTDVPRVSSPRRSDHGSTRTADSHGRSSTARSKQSERSRRSAVAAQAQLESLGEETVRGQIESNYERNLFKMTGQIPPTPTDAGNEDEVYIRTEDLRARCRAASGEKQADDLVKSPKKKLFSSIRNPFTKTSNNVPPPPMPSKAAQVLGTAARQPKVIAVRPIKPARPFEPTPTKPSRSDTSKSLPAKVIDPDSYAHRHRSGFSRRNRPVGRGSPSGGSPTKQSSDAENAPPIPKFYISVESMIPPTPPAKDTPPDQRAASPLRRVAPAYDLRESYSESYDDNYGSYVDKNVHLRYPNFALSPLPSSDVLPINGEASPTSPTKFRPYTAEDYTKLIEGEALQWPYPERGDSLEKPESKRNAATLVSPMFETPKLRRPDRRCEEREGGNRESDYYSPLQPRFYSPKHLSARGFAEGESPSKNSDTSRLLYHIPSKSKSLVHLREDSNDGSIKMIFQGDPSDIDPNSPTGQELKMSHQHVGREMRSDTGITTRVMQELHIREPHDLNQQQHGHSGHLQPDQSSSRLTDMLNTVSPGRSDSHAEFRVNCPSAVPSPLHKSSGPFVREPGPDSPAHSIVRSNRSFGHFPPAPVSKTVDDHFFMTNEHLDVVGKTTWDLLDVSFRRQSADANIKHDQMKEIMEKQFDEIKSEISTVKEKAESTADNQHKVFDSLSSVSDVLKENIPNALSEQDKKLTNMETQIKELKQMVQALQKSSEQKTAEPKINNQSMAPSSFSLPDSRSQPSLTGHYNEAGRDGPPPMPHMHDNRDMASPQDGHNDPRGAYHKGYPQQWGGRPGYGGHNVTNKETNPYHFANGGQYNNGYGNGFSSFNYSPSPPDYPFNQGQAK